MKIPLKPYAIPIWQRSYRLNPVYKNKVKENIDKMLEARVIEHVQESKWTSPMVVHENKQGGFRIYVDMRKLNHDFMHDPFPTPFKDEVLKNIGGKEAYSITNRFSGYH
jgi:hypothetical protein